MTTLQDTPKAAVAYARLKELIESGRLADGEKLTELRATRLLRLRRGPVREAILRLEADGLLQHRGSRRSRVVRYTEDENPQELLRRYELREPMEAAAARLAARHMTGWQIERLRELAQVVQAALAADDYVARDQAARAYFHFLLRHCGNPFFAQVWTQHRLDPPTPRSRETDERIRSRLPAAERKRTYFLDVVAAIAAHDGDRAEACVRATLRRRTAIIQRVLVEGEG